MEAVWIALIAFAIAVGIAVLVGAAISLFLRLRAGAGTIPISMRFLLRLYMYVVIIAGLLIFTQGVSGLIRAGLASGIGKDFSYNPVYVAMTEADELVRTPKPLELKDPPDLTPAEREELSEIIAERERKMIEIRREQRRRGLDRALEEGLIEGVSFTFIGAIIWAMHVLGRRRLETPEERESPVTRIYLILIVVIFGIITIVNLPQAVFESLRYAVLEPFDEFGDRYQPGGKLALSIVTLPIWIIYLMGTIRSVRQGS